MVGMLVLLGLLAGCNKDDAPGAEAGCGDGVCDGDENYMGCSDDCSLPSPLQGDLDACAGGLPQSTIDADLSLLFDVDQDVHEMVACGNLAFRLVGALATIVVDLVGGATELEMPAGYTWEDGQYLASPDASTAMGLRLQWGAGFETAAEGDPVVHDLFDMDSYLIDPELDVDPDTFEVLIRHNGTGPLVELLGFGASPGRPVRLGLDDATVGRFGELLLTGAIEVGTQRDDVEVSYLVDLEPQTVAGVLLSGMGSDLQVLTATDGVATTVADTWEITYLDQPDNSLEGAIGTTTTGGSFSYAATFGYERSGYADRIELSCVDADGKR